MKRKIFNLLYYYNKTTNPTFYFNTQKLEYQQNKKNKTPETNERTIEIPLIKQIMAYYTPNETLEIGNVLQRFGFNKHTIIDLHEKAKNVQNIDINKFKPKEKFNLIISISTLEHITTGNPIKHIKKYCLNKKGKMLFTIPIGFNKKLDQQIKKDKTIKKWYFKRIDKLNRWKQIQEIDSKRIKYNQFFPCANGIILGLI